MDRRSFLKACTLSSASLVLPGLSGWALSTAGGDKEMKRLIVILLRGGMDGLNVVVPYGDPNYYELRPTIAVPRPGNELGVIDLDGHFGLHPALEPLMPFWRNKSLAFVHASGSPDPSRSHFDAQDYMESGIPGQKLSSSGWLNRLVSQLPSEHSHLQALSFGPLLPKIFSGPASVATVNKAVQSNKMALDRPLIAQLFGEEYQGRNDELGRAFAEGIAAHRAVNRALEAPESDPQEMEQIIANRGAPLPKSFASFGKQLANLINKDGTVQVAFIDFGGWDTHINQGTGKGQLANHLTPLAKGLAELVDGLRDLYKHTTIAVMSEFGRTAHENGNGGTDHGHGNVMWLLGGGLSGGKVYGRWSGLAEKDLHEGRDLPTTTDFRNVLSCLLANQMAVSDKALQSVFPNFKLNTKDVLVQT
ncbi:MAG: hypothetical protein C5B53_12800 [Candidatus Melainabacteria bacterium]|nr:MAG: hypothetical protein C5B53_12800 [Candidatus Melainabacteria bacterium]